MEHILGRKISQLKEGRLSQLYDWVYYYDFSELTGMNRGKYKTSVSSLELLKVKYF